MRQRIQGAWRLPLWDRRCFLHPFILRCTDPSNSGFYSSTAPSFMVLAYQLLGSLRISQSPFIYFAFVGVFYLVCRLSIFSSRFQSWRSLALHSHVGQATKFIYALVAAIRFRPVVCLDYFGLCRRLLGSPY